MFLNFSWVGNCIGPLEESEQSGSGVVVGYESSRDKGRCVVTWAVLRNKRTKSLMMDGRDCIEYRVAWALDGCSEESVSRLLQKRG